MIKLHDYVQHIGIPEFEGEVVCIDGNYANKRKLGVINMASGKILYDIEENWKSDIDLMAKC